MQSVRPAGPKITFPHASTDGPLTREALRVTMKVLTGFLRGMHM